MSNRPVNVAAVSFLNAKPLIHHLLDQPDVRLTMDVPARLSQMLTCGAADVALLPVVDLANFEDHVQIVSDACIGCDGPTLTVRVFCRPEPRSVDVLYADTDSHTSVVLAKLLWREMFGKTLSVVPLNADSPVDPETEAILLIGDKVVAQQPGRWPHQIDLGEAWKELTGLPFVFAVWAGRPGIVDDHVSQLLQVSRDEGCARAAELATIYGPKAGWPVDLAQTYLTRHMRYRLDQPSKLGMRRFVEMASKFELLTERAEAFSWMPR